MNSLFRDILLQKCSRHILYDVFTYQNSKIAYHSFLLLLAMQKVRCSYYFCILKYLHTEGFDIMCFKNVALHVHINQTVPSVKLYTHTKHMWTESNVTTICVCVDSCIFNAYLRSTQNTFANDELLC